MGRALTSWERYERERAKEEQRRENQERRERERADRQAQREREREAQKRRNEQERAEAKARRERERAENDREKKERAEQAEREREAERRRERLEAERAAGAYERFRSRILALQTEPSLARAIDVLSATEAPQGPSQYDPVISTLLPMLKRRPVHLVAIDEVPSVVKLRAAMDAAGGRERDAVAAFEAHRTSPKPAEPIRPQRQFTPRTFSSTATSAIATLEGQLRFDLAAFAAFEKKRVASGAFAVLGDLLHRLGLPPVLTRWFFDLYVIPDNLQTFHGEVRGRLQSYREQLARERAAFEQEERERETRADEEYLAAKARFDGQEWPAYQAKVAEWEARQRRQEELRSARDTAAEALRQAKARHRDEVRRCTEVQDQERAALLRRIEGEQATLRTAVHQEMERRRMDWVTKLKAGDTGVMGEALELVLPPRFSLDEDHLQSDPNEFDIGYQILGPDRIALLIVLPQEMTVLPEKELRLKADGQAVAETRISAAKQREAVRYVIAGMVLAVTRLAFGVLPTIERLDVEVQGVTVDKSTGRFRDDPFVTASITRGAAQSLLYDTVDAVAAVTRLASASKDPDDQKILAPLVDRSGLLWAVTDDEVPPQPVGFLFRRGIGDDGRRDASQTAEQIKAMFSDVELVELAGESRPPIRPATAGGRDLILVDGGPRKIEVIKTIRGLLNLGLKEATNMVEAVPQVVRSGIEHEDAILLAGRLTKVGARVEIR